MPTHAFHLQRLIARVRCHLMRDWSLLVFWKTVFLSGVKDGQVEARFHHFHQTTYYKPFHPEQLVYQCIQVMLQTIWTGTNDSTIHSRKDWTRFLKSIQGHGPHCTLSEFQRKLSIIQQVNELRLDCFKVLCWWLSKQHGMRLTIQEFCTLDSFLLYT
jgi:hypothetical protein